MLGLALVVSAVLPLGAVENLPAGGVNVSPVAPWQPAYPFRNLAKMTPNWLSSNGIVWNDGRPLSLTADGYPASLLPDQVARGRVFTQALQYDTGIHDLSWEGTGNVILRSGGGSVVPVSTGGNSGVYNVLSPNPQGILVEIQSTDPGDPVRNIQLNRAGTEGVFDQRYANALDGFGVIRMLDWQEANNSLESTWASRHTLDDASWKTVPYEQQIAIANENNSDLWLTIPHLATNDYITQLGDLVEANLNPNLRVWIENSNETWNGLFAQNQFFGNTANYAQRSAEIFNLFGMEDRRVRVLSGQAANHNILNTAFNNADADVGAINAYFKLQLPEYTELFNDFVNGVADKQKAFDLLRADIDEVEQQWARTKNVLDNHDAVLVAYEGGVNLTVPSQFRGNSGFVDFINSLHDDPRMEELFELHYERWQLYGETMVYYNLAGKWDGLGGLGLVQQFDESTPKWEVVQDVIGRSGWQPGDANLDGQFTTDDMLELFQNGEYEDGVVCNSGWAEGDFDRDCEFTTGDLILALQTWGTYSDSPAPASAASAVPEPALGASLLGASLLVLRRRRR